MAVKPDDPDVWRELGRTSFSLQRYAEAAESYETAANKQNDHAPTWLELARAR